MGRAKKVRKIKRLNIKNDCLKQSVAAGRRQQLKDEMGAAAERRQILENKNRVLDDEDIVKNNGVVEIEQTPSSLFFEYNSQLGPPYQILVDTNFINFSLQHKVDLFKGMMDCLMAKCFPIITDCVLGELEKMGPKYRLALRMANDPRIKRLKCLHKGTYADDCLVNRVKESRCYIVATSDKELKRRIRKIPGVPIMFVTQHKYEIERLPDAISSVPFSNRKVKASLGL